MDGDFDPFDTKMVDAILKEHDVTVSLEGPPLTIGKSLTKEHAEAIKEWAFGWSHGGLDLMGAHRSEEEARAAAAMFVKLWLAKTGLGSPGVLRDIAVIYVNRCFDVAKMDERIDEFLREVKRLDTPETYDDLCAKIYEVNKMQFAGEFDLLNRMLAQFDPFKRSAQASVAFLGYTSQAKDKLPARRTLYIAAVRAEVKRNGEEEAKKVFGALE